MNLMPAQPMYQPSSAGASNFSRIECSGCHTQLMYPPGSANVRCARCGTITPSLPPAVAGNDMAQLTCTNQNCRLPLMYPRGARQVQCSVCGTMNDSMAANSIGHIVCGCCHITLMYAYGASSVKCAVCNHVTPTDSSHAPFRNSTPALQPAVKATQTVVVENPPSLDEDGNEVQNLAVATTDAKK